MLGAGLLVLPCFLPVRAADPAESPGRPANQPPREEVVIERRVVVHDGDERPREQVRERERRLAEMREHASNLRREGRSAEAERVVREIEEMEARNWEGNRPPGRPPGGPRDGGEVGELQRRLHHLHVAMENLRAAEMPDVAMEVERRAREVRRQLEERARQPRPESERPREELEQLRREVAELRGQLEAMRRETGPPKGP
jgi:HPt (histidine-containing phosphotransfer) domain-containing protein